VTPQSGSNESILWAQNPLLHRSASENTSFFNNPYPYYAALREAGPVHRSDAYSDGAWLITRHADVDAVLRDSQRFRAQRTGSWVMQHAGLPAARLRGFQSLLARALLFVDEPDHPRLRGVMTPAFRQDTLQRAAGCISACVSHYLDQMHATLLNQGVVDWMQAVAKPLPLHVVAQLMGILAVPSGEIESSEAAHTLSQLGAWCDDIANFIGAVHASTEQTELAQKAVWALADFLEPLIQARRGHPQHDWISLLTQAQSDGIVHNRSELLAQCVMLLFAGHETTRNLLGNGLHAMLKNPAAWHQTRENPQNLNSSVRELLRHDSPVQYTARRVAADVTLHGHTLRRGDAVIALMASANRDPARYSKPDELDLNRQEGSSLSFGVGPHACIGAALTLMEAQAVFCQAQKRWPHLHRVPSREAAWHHNPVYRGLESLWVQI
jgi:cytochrome P450